MDRAVLVALNWCSVDAAVSQLLINRALYSSIGYIFCRYYFCATAMLDHFCVHIRIAILI